MSLGKFRDSAFRMCKAILRGWGNSKREHILCFLTANTYLRVCFRHILTLECKLGREELFREALTLILNPTKQNIASMCSKEKKCYNGNTTNNIPNVERTLEHDQKCIKCSHVPKMFQKCSKMLKMLKMLQDAPRCSKMFQDVPRCSQMFPNVPKC